VVWGLNHGGNEIFHTCPDQPWDPLSQVSFPRVKWWGCGVDHTPPSSAKGKERVELYLYSSLGLHGQF